MQQELQLQKKKQQDMSRRSSQKSNKQPFSTRSSRVVSLERLRGNFFTQDESAHRKEFFDIDLYGKSLRETLPINDLELR